MGNKAEYKERRRMARERQKLEAERRLAEERDPDMTMSRLVNAIESIAISLEHIAEKQSRNEGQ